ncbi:MAG TPA: phosphoesterase [Anaerolineae bacterium]|nr:phosphoesterase [Anaerolineae bacterium]HOQ97544.1 phosphoesterase [Anaerolineae bacterium]HPL28372.1 phosphoesterase [Anaerolineae bacterium]
MSSLEQVAEDAPAVRPEGSWQRAEQALRTFLAAVPRDARHVLLCHSDADGLAAGVLFYRALERAGRPDVRLLAAGKGETAWSLSMLERVAPLRPAALFVLDLGSRSKPIFPGVPTLLIDHHTPLGVPPGGRLISSFEWHPASCSSVMAYWLGMTLAGIEDLAWIAAIGIIGDQGGHATVRPLPQVREQYGSHTLHEARVLVSAARRSSSGDAAVALDALLAAHEPADIAACRLPQARELAEMRRAFDEALCRVRGVAPAISGRVALIRVHSPYLVHPALAQLWRSRLPERIVLVANEGYLPGQVAFSLRTCLDVNLLDYIQAFRQSVNATELGYGHDKATGGMLPAAEFKRFLATLGFR